MNKIISINMKTSISLIIVICLYILVQAQTIKNETFTLLIGTFTSPNNSDGIYVYDFNSQTGDFNFKSKVAGIENPSYLAISLDGKYVYSVNEVSNGGISAFAFNSVSGELTLLNRVSSGGTGPCYVSVDKKNKFVFAGHFGSGSVSAISLNEDGSLSSDIQIIQQEGSSIDKSIQQGPHVHSAVLSPDNQYLLTANLGTDEIYTYKFDASVTAKPLTPADPPFVSVKPGNGPRHIVFHPNSKFVYVVNEMGASITAFDYKNGKLNEKQTITMLPSGYVGAVEAGDIHVSPDGRFLYGSNRGDADDITIYAINKNGELSYAGRQSTLGKSPRIFDIDPTGNFVLAANGGTDDVVIFKRDKKTGLLTPTGKKIQVTSPGCLKFVTVN
jgi:6-phosphogluconolactonase